MTDLREYEGLAAAVVRRSLRIRPGESVVVECWNHGLDLAKEIVFQVRSIGARSMLLFEDEGTYWRSVESLPTTKLGQVSESEWAALAKADAYIFIPGPADIGRYRKNLPKSQVATAYNAEWYRRAERAGLRAARPLLGYVTRERAAAYGFDYDAWRTMVIAASTTDFAPIARRGKRIQRLLSKAGDVEITSPNGTHVTFRLGGRPAILDDGIVDAADVRAGEFICNVPPGSAYVAAEESSAEGTLIADLPEAYMGSLVTGIRFEFRDGHAGWSADDSPATDRMRASFDKAGGHKDRLGGLSVGLNPAATYGFLQDDLVAGACQVWIGSNTDEGGRNKTGFSLSGKLSGATVRIGRQTLIDAGRLAV